MSRKSFRYNLDTIDFSLIAELETDPRQRYVDLGAKLGVDANTAKRRLNRLVKEGFIAFKSLFNTAAIGYSQSILGVAVPQGYTESIANELDRYISMHVMITSGRYDIGALVTYRDPEMLYDFISNDLGKISHITSIEAFPVLKILKFSTTLFGNINFKPFSSRINRQLEESDWNILFEIEKNPRITITQLARKLGTGRQTTGVKFQRLLDEDIIRINCVISPTMIGYEFHTSILIKTRPKNIHDVAERLIANKSTYAVIATSGRYDLMAGAIFKNSDEISNFYINELGAIPNIISRETILVLKVLSDPLTVQDARLYLQNQRNEK